MTESIGKWAFILGVVIAVIAGLVGGWAAAYSPWILLVLVVLGLIVGFLNISAKEFIEVKRSGQIKGDILTNKIVVIEGGVIDGAITMKKEGGKVVELNKEIIKEANQ